MMELLLRKRTTLMEVWELKKTSWTLRDHFWNENNTVQWLSEFQTLPLFKMVLLLRASPLCKSSQTSSLKKIIRKVCAQSAAEKLQNELVWLFHSAKFSWFLVVRSRTLERRCETELQTLILSSRSEISLTCFLANARPRAEERESPPRPLPCLKY